MKLVMVQWHDAHAETETWIDLDTMGSEGPYVVRSAGWLLPKRNTKAKHLTLALSVSADGYVDSVLHIPKKMIVEVTPLGEVADEIVIPGTASNGQGSRQSSAVPPKGSHPDL